MLILTKFALNLIHKGFQNYLSHTLYFNLLTMIQDYFNIYNPTSFYKYCINNLLATIKGYLFVSGVLHNHKYLL